MVKPLGIILLERKREYTTFSVRFHVYTQLRLIKTVYMLTLNVYAGSLHKSKVYTWVSFTKVAYTLWHIIFIIFLALTGILFSAKSELIWRYIILTSLAHRLLIIGNSLSRFPLRTTSSSRLPSSSSSGLPSRTTLLHHIANNLPLWTWWQPRWCLITTTNVYIKHNDILPLFKHHVTLPLWHQGKRADPNQHKVFLLM